MAGLSWAILIYTLIAIVDGLIGAGRISERFVTSIGGLLFFGVWISNRASRGLT